MSIKTLFQHTSDKYQQNQARLKTFLDYKNENMFFRLINVYCAFLRNSKVYEKD